MSTDWNYNGWIVYYYVNGSKIDFGWRSNGKWNGNRVCIKSKDMSIDTSLTGWFENNEKVSDLKNDFCV